jgi:hypothetical protein
MKNINKLMHNPVLLGYREGKFGNLLPPGWGMEYTSLTHSFSKAFNYFGGGFIPMHTTTQQIKIQIYHEMHKLRNR